ncbi:hypothetical protein NDU88_002011 [Pleurodeles waltl]|uniref:Putative nuclease HARBI1 n=1 Tax=Pleurodeles waltl TaxID=8319 RepID=A0AAV7R8R5_PLEWA|nr:hypothetical protein NDU88_002011 [Pleurodeles waltl]
MCSYIAVSQEEDLATVKAGFYAMGHIPNIIVVIDGTHIAFVPHNTMNRCTEIHSLNVQVVCLADQYISNVTAKYPGSLHDTFFMRDSSIPNVMAQLQRRRVWLIGDSGNPHLSWLLTPVNKARTGAENRYNDAHGRTRRIIERTFGLLKARFKCLQLTGGTLCYSPEKVCKIVVLCCMLHNLALRRHVPYLQEEEVGNAPVAAVDPEDSENEDVDNRTSVIWQYFQ